jgi:hypothetical protein
MTIPASEVVAATEAQQSVSILRRLRLSVLLATLPFGMLILGLPLIAREMGACALVIGGLAFGISALLMVLGAVLALLFVREPARTQAPAL